MNTSKEATVKTDNELIAEFMGSKPYEDGRYGTMWPDPTNGNNVGFSLKYDSSWDWLMPVVEKIESLDDEKSVNINGPLCLIKGDHTAVGGWDLITASADGPTKIEAVYKAVVEFIKWYNSQQHGK